MLCNQDFLGKHFIVIIVLTNCILSFIDVIRCGEPQVLDYQTQQHKLFPLLATAYAFHTVGVWMLDFHSTVMNEINEGHYHRLAEVCCSRIYLEVLYITR